MYGFWILRAEHPHVYSSSIASSLNPTISRYGPISSCISNGLSWRFAVNQSKQISLRFWVCWRKAQGAEVFHRLTGSSSKSSHLNVAGREITQDYSWPIDAARCRVASIRGESRRNARNKKVSIAVLHCCTWSSCNVGT